MPMDLDQQGNNPFFVGYRETDTTGRSSSPGNANSRLFLFDKVWRQVRSIAPDLTRHEKDMLAHKFEQSGILSNFGKKGFDEELRGMIGEITGAAGRVVNTYISTRMAADNVD